MAKKPGMMNDSKRHGSMDPIAVANVMAKAAHIKAQSKGKPYVEGADETGVDNPAMNGTDKPNPSKDGAKHPSAPAAKPSHYSGEQHKDMKNGAKSKKSAMKKKDSDGDYDND